MRNRYVSWYFDGAVLTDILWMNTQCWQVVYIVNRTKQKYSFKNVYLSWPSWYNATFFIGWHVCKQISVQCKLKINHLDDQWKCERFHVASHKQTYACAMVALWEQVLSASWPWQTWLKYMPHRRFTSASYLSVAAITFYWISIHIASLAINIISGRFIYVYIYIYYILYISNLHEAFTLSCQIEK